MALKVSTFVQLLKMAPAPNFRVFLDFAHPFLTENDFRICLVLLRKVRVESRDLCIRNSQLKICMTDVS